MTDAEAKAAYDAAEPVPLSDERINEIVAYATDPVRRAEILERRLLDKISDNAALRIANARLRATLDEYRAEKLVLTSTTDPEIQTVCRRDLLPDYHVMQLDQVVRLAAELSEARERLAAVDRELAALRMVHTEARELVGEADAAGTIPQANLDALRCLLHRASQRRATP